MADLVVQGRLELETDDFEKGVNRAEQSAEKLVTTQRRRSQYDVEGSSAAAKASETASSAASTAATTANQAVEAAAKRVVAESQVGQAVQATANALKQGVAADSASGAAGGFLSRLGGSTVALGATLAVLTVLYNVVSQGTRLAEAAEQRQRQFTLELTASGNAAGTTATALERLVKAEAMRSGVSRTQAGEAVGALALNPNLDEGRIARTLALSTDFARITGEQLPAAAANLSKALDGTVASARSLDQTWNFLTASELAQIRELEEQGRKAEVVSVVLGAMERNFKGANEQGVSPLTKGLSDLSSAWVVFETKIGQSAIIQKLLSGTGAALSAIGAGLNSLTGGASDGPTKAALTADLAQAQVQLARAEEQLRETRSATGRAAIDPRNPYTNGILQAQEERVAKLRANVEALQQQISSTSVEGDVAVQSQAAVTQLQREAKEFGDRLAAANTVQQQRTKLDAEMKDLERNVRQGGLSPVQLDAANERIATIRGALFSLVTPSDQIQRNLNLQEKLALVPPQLRGIEQAWMQTYLSARGAQDTHDQAVAKADQAKRIALQEQATGTAQQISLLSIEAQGALATADAYGKSRAAGIRSAAESAAAAAQASGAIAPGTAGRVAQETLEKNASAAVSAAAEKNRAYGEELVGLQRLVAAEAVSTEAAREAERVNRVAALSIQLRAQAEAAGGGAIAAAAEQQIATYDRLSRQQLTLDRQRAGQQLNSQLDPNTAFGQRMAQLAQLQATGILTERTIAEATKRYEQERLDASRRATDGMQAGLRRYADDATNAGKNASQAIQQSFKSMEDALVQFVMTGQLNFANLANAIIADLARIAIRQAITGPIAAGLGSAFSGWFGGGKGADPNTINYGGGSPEQGYFHGGGIVGGAPTFTRAVDPMLFANAPRYHGGGVVLGADEVPIIARKGERVLTEEQQRAWNGGGGGAAAPEVNIYNNTDSKVSTKRGTTPQGAPRLDIIFEQAEEQMASNVLRSRGPLHAAMTSRYGLSTMGT
ncbi:MAG: phage tail length tape measure family protein [Alphaproteobacteria bacterium]|nr:phage tail length tape measure family protein [Alphaproteobacteria bacterium]